MRRKQKSDCDLLLNDVENVFGSLGNSIDAAFDERQTKMDVAKGVFGIGKNLLKFGFNGTKCVVKHTPKAIATVASAKRELTDTITEEYHKYQIEQKEQELDDKIAQLKYKSKTKLLS